MSEYNLISISSTWLTDTGTNVGLPCKTEVRNLDQLQLSHVGPVRKSVSGKPLKFTLPNLGKGVELAIEILVTKTAEFTAVKTILNTALAGSSTFVVTIVGATGSFNLTCIPGALPIAFPGDFTPGRILNVTLNLVVYLKN